MGIIATPACCFFSVLVLYRYKMSSGQGSHLSATCVLSPHTGFVAPTGSASCRNDSSVMTTCEPLLHKPRTASDAAPTNVAWIALQTFESVNGQLFHQPIHSQSNARSDWRLHRHQLRAAVMLLTHDNGHEVRQSGSNLSGKVD
eukprot:Selendium_serpulae@DN9482_c0_g1_i1.p3